MLFRSALSGREKNGSLPSPPVSEPRGSAEGSDGERIQGSKVEKKANPLEDLIHTETLYVEDLGAIIKVRSFVTLGYNRS